MGPTQFAKQLSNEHHNVTYQLALQREVLLAEGHLAKRREAAQAVKQQMQEARAAGHACRREKVTSQECNSVANRQSV